MRRPSASVLSTSTVVPSLMVRTSPGVTALPPGRLSVAGIRPTTCTGSPRRAAPDRAPNTAAAPLMSDFMVSMELVGFKLNPPVS